MYQRTVNGVFLDATGATGPDRNLKYDQVTPVTFFCVLWYGLYFSVMKSFVNCPCDLTVLYK